MMSLVAKNPTALRFVAKSLNTDTDVAISALSATDGVLSLYYAACLPDIVGHHWSWFWLQVAGIICEKLQGHHVLVKLILPSIHFCETKPCALATMNQGQTTTTAIMETIAQFADIPIGKEVEVLRRAHKNLESSEYHFFSLPQ